MTRWQEFANHLIHPAFLGSMIYDFTREVGGEMEILVHDGPLSIPAVDGSALDGSVITVIAVKLGILAVQCLDYAFTQPIRHKRDWSVALAVAVLYYLAYQFAPLVVIDTPWRYAPDLLLALVAFLYSQVNHNYTRADRDDLRAKTIRRLCFGVFAFALLMALVHGAGRPTGNGWTVVLTCVLGSICFVVAIRKTPFE